MICPLTDRPTAIEVEVRHTTGVGLGVAVVRRKGVGVVRRNGVNVVRSKGVGVVRGNGVGVRRSKSVGVVRRTGVGVSAALLAAKPSMSTTATNPPKRPSRSRRWVLQVMSLPPASGMLPQGRVPDAGKRLIEIRTGGVVGLRGANQLRPLCVCLQISARRIAQANPTVGSAPHLSNPASGAPGSCPALTATGRRLAGFVHRNRPLLIGAEANRDGPRRSWGRAGVWAED